MPANYGFDYYNFLNVNFTATTDDIKRSYRQLAKVYHPDCGGSAFEFKKLLIAYETLSDPQKRAAYNEWYKTQYMAAQQTSNNYTQHTSTSKMYLILQLNTDILSLCIRFQAATYRHLT